MIAPFPGQRTTRTRPFATRSGRLYELANRAARHYHAASQAGDPNAPPLRARADRLFDRANAEHLAGEAARRHPYAHDRFFFAIAEALEARRKHGID